jgi:redox-sensing transcriptional repressor
LVAAGVTSILNFAPTVINVPHGISVGKVDLAVELQILAYHEQRRINATKGSSLVSVPGESRRGASA